MKPKPSSPSQPPNRHRVKLVKHTHARAHATTRRARPQRFVETLTGFKWLGNVAAQLEGEGYTVLFAYEEAIGFMFNAIHKVRPGRAVDFVSFHHAGSRKSTLSQDSGHRPL
jgi:hypothetical protein